MYQPLLCNSNVLVESQLSWESVKVPCQIFQILSHNCSNVEISQVHGPLPCLFAHANKVPRAFQKVRWKDTKMLVTSKYPYTKLSCGKHKRFLWRNFVQNSPKMTCLEFWARRMYLLSVKMLIIQNDNYCKWQLIRYVVLCGVCKCVPLGGVRVIPT